VKQGVSTVQRVLGPIALGNASRSWSYLKARLYGSITDSLYSSAAAAPALSLRCGLFGKQGFNTRRDA